MFEAAFDFFFDLVHAINPKFAWFILLSIIALGIYAWI
jgi:hypothetical protein